MRCDIPGDSACNSGFIIRSVHSLLFSLVYRKCLGSLFRQRWRWFARVTREQLPTVTLVSPFPGIKWWFPKAAWLRPMKACTEDSMLLVQTGCFSRSRVVPPEKKLNERPLSVLACFQILHIHGVQ